MLKFREKRILVSWVSMTTLGVVTLVAVACNQSGGSAASPSPGTPSAPTQARQFDPAPREFKLSEITGGKDGMLFQLNKDIELLHAATEESRIPGVAPGPNTLYFIEGRVFQKTKPVDPYLSSLTDLDSKRIETELGGHIRGNGKSPGYDWCELDLLTEVGTMTLTRGTRFSLDGDDAPFIYDANMTIPLLDPVQPGVALGQFRCTFPTLEGAHGENRPIDMEDLKTVVRDRLDFLISRK